MDNISLNVFEITEELQLRRIIPCFHYIASAENPADAPSRQLPTNAEKVSSVTEEMKKYSWGGGEENAPARTVSCFS